MQLFKFLAALLIIGNSALGTGSAHVSSAELFTEVVRTNDTGARDDVFVTPALLFVGKSNGDILRCLFKDPTVCETFYSHTSSTGITSIVLRGEYLYASADRNILKCDLYEKSCTIFNTFSSYVKTLGIAVGYPSTISYIYAALEYGELVRCKLHEPDSCSNYKTFSREITSLATGDKFMHVGLAPNQIWRCSMAAGPQYGCGLIYTADSEVRGITAFDRTAIFVSQNGTFYNYTMARDDISTHNAYTSSPNTQFKSIAAFDRSLYALHNSKIVVCEWGSLGNCSHYARHKGALSIAFAYSTHRMQERYVGEEKRCLVRPCTPLITYYDITQRPNFEVFVDNGRIYQFLGGLPGAYVYGNQLIFAMSADGQILVSKSNRHESNDMATSSMFAGRPVAAAGKIVVQNGFVKIISACSDHYRTTVGLNQQMINALYLRGHTSKIESIPCCSSDECRSMIE